MSDSEFNAELSKIMTNVHTLPVAEQEKVKQLAADSRDRHEKLRKTVHSLQESLDYLRLSVKYLVFDLEATRRENQYLRKLLEETREGGNDSTSAD
jgi:predicted enzyme involved in methoxymalonyl-ACP biosynthesis